jgi:2-octaprenyl-6-methoxyphenol hydroxylase
LPQDRAFYTLSDNDSARQPPMLHDLVIVGAGPVGAAAALALADGEIDVVTLDARAEGAIGRGDRSLALSHGSRLILERLGIWADVDALPGAVTPIRSIDISQRGGFGHACLDAAEEGLPALGYVVSYRALQAALDGALARAGRAVVNGVSARRITSTPAYAAVEAERAGERVEYTARLVAVADGGGSLVPGLARRRHDYLQVALVGKVWPREPHRGVAFERFTPDGPMALLPEADRYGFVWTTTPVEGAQLLALPEPAFLRALEERFGSPPDAEHPRFQRVEERRIFPLALEFADRVAGRRIALMGNAAQALHPVAGQGFNLGVRDAFELAQELLSSPRNEIGSEEQLARYARRRQPDRIAGIAFTHGLLGVFGVDASWLRWPRGLALTLLGALPPAKRKFTRAMLFGVR